MSDLDRELLAQYNGYMLVSESVELKKGDLDHKVYYVFTLYDTALHKNLQSSLSSNDSIMIMVGLHTPLCSFDPQRNIFMWADAFNMMHKSIGDAVASNKKIVRSALQKDRSDLYELIKKDVGVSTIRNISSIIKAASQILNKEIVVNYRQNMDVYFFHVVDKVLHDYRERVNVA